MAKDAEKTEVSSMAHYKLTVKPKKSAGIGELEQSGWAMARSEAAAADLLFNFLEAKGMERSSFFKPKAKKIPAEAVPDFAKLLTLENISAVCTQIRQGCVVDKLQGDECGHGDGDQHPESDLDGHRDGGIADHELAQPNEDLGQVLGTDKADQGGDKTAAFADFADHADAPIVDEPTMSLNPQGTQSQVDEIETQIHALLPGERLRLVGVPAEVYHATAGYGSTAIKEAHKSMMHFDHYINSERDITPQLQAIFDQGSAVHCAVLEPHLYDQEFAAYPPGVRKTSKDGKSFSDANPGKTMITAAVQDSVFAMRNRLLADPYTAKLLTAGESEVSYWYREPTTGVIIKARVDHDHDRVMVDLKTTKDETPEEFRKTLFFTYAVQDALYKLVTGKASMFFVGVCKKAPHRIYVGERGEFATMKAEKELMEVLEQIKQAQESQKYLDKPLELITAELNEYQIDQFFNEL